MKNKEELKFKNRQIGAAGFVANKIMENMINKPKLDTVGKEFYESADKVITVKRQEEPKPHSFCETPDEKCTMNYCDENGCQNRKRELVEPQENPKQQYNNLNYGGGFTEEDIKRVSTKQETLEEVMNQNGYHDSKINDLWREGVEFGIKWQAERMYEIMNAYVDDVMGGCNLRAKEWFEKFKSK
jgi:hypothetical protein